MSGDSSTARLDAALSELTHAADETRLAMLLAEHAVVLTGATSAEVVDIEGDSVRSTARAGTIGGLSVDDRTAAQVRAAIGGDASSDISIMLDDGCSATIFAAARNSGTLTAVIVAGRLSGVPAEQMALLTDVAGATMDRLEAERELRGHADHVRRLGADLIALADSGVASRVPDEHSNDEFQTATAELTDREREILEIVTTGASNAQIAEQLTVSVETVKTHVKHILRKLNAANRSELIATFGGTSRVTGSNRQPLHGSRPDPR